MNSSLPKHEATPLPLAEGLTREYLLHHRVCPRLRREDGAIVVAAAPEALADEALLQDAIDDIGFVYGGAAGGPRASIVTESATWDEVERLIERLTTRAEREIELSRIELSRADQAGSEDDLTTDVRDLATQPPVVRYVNLLVRDAFDAGASDIHLEATREGMAARFRLDGVLQAAPEPPVQLQYAVVSRIKLLAELDIAERRRPQDGRIRVRLETRELDLRVSTVPTMFGESVVLRLLDRGGRPVELGELGMSARMLERVAYLSGRPHGMLLVTGPTGSGKTTTLYACLQRREIAVEKIVTVEDPVEYQLSGVTQVPVHRQAGVTFATALRSILRQDPDVVMIGEMRDGETAEIAVQAAMTGHLVFSTLHTNDAVGAIARLLDLGVPEYLVAATIEGVLGQRLVRRICDACRVEHVPSADGVAFLTERLVNAHAAYVKNGNARYWRGAGCPDCRGTGYRGRTGLYELLIMTDAVKDAITRRASRAELRACASEAGLQPLRVDGWAKVLSGLTTVEEVLRVAQD